MSDEIEKLLVSICYSNDIRSAQETAGRILAAFEVMRDRIVALEAENQALRQRVIVMGEALIDAVQTLRGNDLIISANRISKALGEPPDGPDAQPAAMVCRWTEHPAFWAGDCGAKFSQGHSAFTYCPRCGRKIEVQS